MVVVPASVFPPSHWVLKMMQGASVGTADHYCKQTIRNRYTILGVNGPLMLTVPVEGQKGQKIPLRDIRLFGTSWQSNHWHSVRSAYGKSAYFIHCADDLAKLYSGQFTFLLDFQIEAWESIRQLTGLPAWTICDEPGHWSPELESEWEPSFIDEQQKPYIQVFADRMPFVPGLSILDAAMNLGPRTISHFRDL